MGHLKLSFVVIILGFIANISFAQDIHFSTYDANPMFLNPASTAFGANSFRIGTIYRNQWSSVAKGYNTYLLSVETIPYQNRIHKQGIGLGIKFLSDIAGSLRYGQQSIGISLSYFKALNPSKENYISFGLETNTNAWNYDDSKAVFGNNPEDAEGIPLNNIRNFDFGLGLHWQIKPIETHHFQAGFSLLHINQPSLSYYENTNIFLPMKFNAYISDLITLTESHSLSSSLFIQKQDKNLELVFGSDYNINLSQTLSNAEILSFGIYYRIIDALILMGKYRYNNFIIGISYDINLSMLTPASKTYGGVELWLRYSFDISPKSKSRTTIPCPEF